MHAPKQSAISDIQIQDPQSERYQTLGDNLRNSYVFLPTTDQSSSSFQSQSFGQSVQQPVRGQPLPAQDISFRDSPSNHQVHGHHNAALVQILEEKDKHILILKEELNAIRDSYNTLEAQNK